MAANGKDDPKAAALRAEQSLNPHPEAVSDPRFADSEFFDARDAVQVKYEMLRRAGIEGDSVTRAAAEAGLSRPTFYAARAALERSGLAGLVRARPGPRGAHKLTEEIVEFAERRLAGDPRLGSSELANAIFDRFEVKVHPRSVERALARSKSERSR